MLKQIGLAVALTVIATPAFVAGPALAQGVAAPIELTVTTQEGVLAACTNPNATKEACSAAIASYFAYLKSQGIAGTALQAAIADLVVALAETNVSDAVLEVVVAAIEEIGNTYATGEQKAAILRIAEAVRSGEDLETAVLGISRA